MLDELLHISKNLRQINNVWHKVVGHWISLDILIGLDKIYSEIKQAVPHKAQLSAQSDQCVCSWPVPPVVPSSI